MTSKKAAWAMVMSALLALPAMAQLQTRDNTQVGYGYGQNYIPDATRLVVVLQDKLETNKIQSGKHFTAKLAKAPRHTWKHSVSNGQETCSKTAPPH